MSTTPSRDATIQLGPDLFVGLMPRLPLVFALRQAMREAQGYTEADQLAIAELEDGSPLPPPSGKPIPGNAQAIYAATVAAWWQGYPLDLPRFHGPEVARDVVLWGELALGAFRVPHRSHLVQAGRKLWQQMEAVLVAEYAAVQEARGE
jgi:hypothetical protein